MRIKYTGQEGGTSKAQLTRGKIYEVIKVWNSEFVLIADDLGVEVDLWHKLFEVVGE